MDTPNTNSPPPPPPNTNPSPGRIGRNALDTPVEVDPELVESLRTAGVTRRQLRVGRAAPRLASRDARKKVPPKQRIAEIEESLVVFGALLMRIRDALEPIAGRPIGRDILK